MKHTCALPFSFSLIPIYRFRVLHLNKTHYLLFSNTHFTFALSQPVKSHGSNLLLNPCEAREPLATTPDVGMVTENGGCFLKPTTTMDPFNPQNLSLTPEHEAFQDSLRALVKQMNIELEKRSRPLIGYVIITIPTEGNPRASACISNLDKTEAAYVMDNHLKGFLANILDSFPDQIKNINKKPFDA